MSDPVKMTLAEAKALLGLPSVVYALNFDGHRLIGSKEAVEAMKRQFHVDAAGRPVVPLPESIAMTALLPVYDRISKTKASGEEELQEAIRKIAEAGFSAADVERNLRDAFSKL